MSGIPLGAALTALAGWLQASVIILWIILIVQTGHTIAPMALAWSHSGFRGHMAGRPFKYVLVPIAIMLASAVVGFAYGGQVHFDPAQFAIASGPQSWSDLKSPFLAMVALYAGWNAYHFGKQAFGVMSIYRRKRGGGGSRRLDLFYCCAVVWSAMVMPAIPRIGLGLNNMVGWPAHPHPFLDNVRLGYLAAAALLPAAMLLHEWFTTRSLPRAIFILTDGLALYLTFQAGLWGFAIIGLNHWLVAIGLASHLHNRLNPWPFALAACALGFVLFTLLFFNLPSVWAHGFTMAGLAFPATAVAFRLGLGFVHFLYDRWIYKSSSPIWVTENAQIINSRVSGPADHRSVSGMAV